MFVKEGPWCVAMFQPVSADGVDDRSAVLFLNVVHLDRNFSILIRLSPGDRGGDTMRWMVETALGLSAGRWAATPWMLRPSLWRFWIWPQWRDSVARAKTLLGRILVGTYEGVVHAN